ncbi:MAG: hypothetical protein ACKPKO_33110, partial [Candidatus Fonsibacter sp.]
GGPQGGAFGVAIPKARAKPRSKAKDEKPEASVKNTIDKIIESSKLPPGQQALLPKRHLTTKAARPKKGRKKKGEGIDPILEHNDIHNDPYYIKPPLPTHIK